MGGTEESGAWLRCLRNSKDFLLEVYPNMLTNTCNEGIAYLDRGSFGVATSQVYCGIYVAVKEPLPCTCISDVISEAMILSQLSHPNLPYCFGVCSRKTPYSIVVQFDVIYV